MCLRKAKFSSEDSTEYKESLSDIKSDLSVQNMTEDVFHRKIIKEMAPKSRKNAALEVPGSIEALRVAKLFFFLHGVTVTLEYF